MTMVVTGAGGFLGGALVRALLAEGHQVRALVRRSQQARDLAALGATPIVGDVTDLASCMALAAEGAVIVHAAARVALQGRWRDFHQATVLGTQRLLEAALPRRPRRFVYVSSAAVYRPIRDRRGLRADRSPTGPPRYNFYGRAKLAAEGLVRRRCADVDCPWTILRLGFLYGPGSRALLEHFLPMARDGKLRIVGSGSNRLATVYIDDAVAAVLRAAALPVAAGRVYDVAGDEPVTQEDFVQATAAALGLPPIRRRLGKRAAFVAAWLVERWAAWTGRRARISRALVDLMSTDQTIDASLARAELGWQPRVSFAEGMRRTREWYRRLTREGTVSEGESLPAPASRVPA